MKKSLLLILVLVSAISAHARPQYSAIMGQACFLCHVNPTGFGMRDSYGSQFFAQTYLPMQPTHFEMLDKLRPDLSESVSIGADLRTIYLTTNTPADTLEGGLSAPYSTNTGTLAQMEGYIYLNLRASDRFSIYYSQGVAQASGRFEAYGLINFPKYKSWIKGGQFQENYGWRFADHTSYVRTGLWSRYTGTFSDGPVPPGYGVGAEFGSRPFGTDFTISYTGAQNTFPSDLDSRKRWVGRYMLQRRVPKVGVVVTAGASGYASPSDAMHMSPGEKSWGGFGGLSWDGLPGRRADSEGFGLFATTILFEYDRKDWTPSWAPFDATFTFKVPTTSAYSTTQIDVMLMQGIWLQAAYDWMNNSETYTTGGESERTTWGLNFFPLPGIEVSPRYRLYSTEGVSGYPTAERNKQQFELQGHFFF